MLLKAAIMLRVVSERALQPTPRSKSNFAPELVILRVVMILKSVSCSGLVFGSRLVQNNCICTLFKDGGERSFTIKTLFGLDSKNAHLRLQDQMIHGVMLWHAYLDRMACNAITIACSQ